MKRYNKSGALWAMDSNDWMATILVPKQRDFKSFKLFLQGHDKYSFDFAPNYFTNVLVPQLVDKWIRITVQAEEIQFLENALYSQWVDITTLIAQKDKDRFHVFDKDNQAVDYDPDEFKQYFLPDGQQLSFRWEFTIPYGARAGGEVYLRAL